eukprot:TRINITY_DN7424_c0_g1_i1.p1 TRINITY_DN7424_c0_g1~~TRINITY_DN7424_c0_g1_i1.p1  ORF type:complete len:174 (-),score=49.72 TRINITY_DN7424_c0_g1_i1:128-649(-)
MLRSLVGSEMCIRDRFNTPSTPLPPSTSHVQLGDDDNIVGAAAPALDVGNADDENDDPAESTDDEKDGQDVREGPDEADGSENDAAVNNAEDVPPATPTVHERGANPTTFHSSPSPPPPSPNIAVGAAASHSVVDGDGCYDRDEDHKYESLAFRGDTPPSLCLLYTSPSPRDS